LGRGGRKLPHLCAIQHVILHTVIRLPIPLIIVI
jgi:hypothetical protein